MSMYCARCLVDYTQKLECPICGERLQYKVGDPKAQKPGASGSTRQSWRTTPWGRLLVGISLAVAMNHVLTNLVASAQILAVEHGQDGASQTIDAILRLQGLEAASIFLAAMLTGAGQSNGIFYGAFVGVWCSLLFQWLHGLGGTLNDAGSQIASSLLLLSFGAAGGLVGSLGWRPGPKSNLTLSANGVPTMRRRKRRASAYDGPVAWIRVCMGIPIAVGGVICASSLREFIVDLGQGKFVVDSHLPANIIAGEISALAILIGGALAGATRRNGLKQGLFVGIGTAAVLLAVRLIHPHIAPELFVLSVVGAMCLSLTGGWFGSQLLPPIRLHTGPRVLAEA